MDATEKNAISISKALFDQSKLVAEQLKISPNQLFEMAVARFIENSSVSVEGHLGKPGKAANASLHANGEPSVINQGDIFWIQAENSGETNLGFYPHPYVVIQDNLLNHSRIHSVVVCALTTNMKQANTPGNVLLEAGEANLPKQSAVVVSKVTAVNKSHLGAYIGSLSEQRIQQILAGMRLLQSSFFSR